MIENQQPRLVETANPARANDVRVALRQLAKAYQYARYLRYDPWQFAVEIGRLLASGVTTSDLRWWVAKGYVEHACEVRRAGDVSLRA